MIMKRGAKKRDIRDAGSAYDFRGGERGKYALRFAEGTNLVRLAPDVSKVFPTEESVNAALRACAEIVRAQRRKRA